MSRNRSIGYVRTVCIRRTTRGRPPGRIAAWTVGRYGALIRAALTSMIMPIFEIVGMGIGEVWEVKDV